jgi:hypothetical protein
MSTEQQGSDAPDSGASEESHLPSLSGVTPYQVARLAVELSKIPGAVTENPTWGDRSLLAIHLLELAQEQLAERQRSPVNRFFNEPLAIWRIERESAYLSLRSSPGRGKLERAIKNRVSPICKSGTSDNRSERKESRQ